MSTPIWRCRVGDLATVYRTKAPGLNPIYDSMLGRPVKVIGLIVGGHNGCTPMCQVEPFDAVVSFVSKIFGETGQLHQKKVGDIIKITGIPDAFLLPFRPGNAPDETLSWAPVPTTTPATPATTPATTP